MPMLLNLAGKSKIILPQIHVLVRPYKTTIYWIKVAVLLVFKRKNWIAP
jgi:hypothetical protein